MLAGSDGATTHTITVTSRGSRLIGAAKSIEVARDQVAELLLDGFFPHCALDEKPTRRRISGFQEIGLPFEADTAITRHLAGFLASQGSDGQPSRPTHVLFNGGVFKAAGLKERLLEVLSAWFRPVKRAAKQPSDAPLRLSGTHDLDHAVARGAAVYGYAKHRGGLRIRGGTARSYYVGIETSGLAIPGARAHCGHCVWCR